MKRILAIIFAALALQTGCLADGLDIEIPESAEEFVSRDAGESGDTDSVLKKLGDALGDKLREAASPSIKKAVSLVFVCLICSAASLFASDCAADVIRLAGCAAAALICAGDIDSYVHIGQNAINDISDFSKAILPTLCTAGVSSGTAGASAAKYAASTLFIDLFVTAAQNIIMPLILIFLALSVAAAAFSNKSLTAMAKLAKWASSSLMTVLTLAFTVYLGISSAVSSGGDALASKVAKTAISTALPVVGGIISDAAASVVAGAAILKNTAGVLGMLAVLGICLVPFAVLGANYLLLKAAGAIGGTLEGSGGAAAVIDGAASAVGMMLGLVGSAGIMLFISILSFVKAVSGI